MRAKRSDGSDLISDFTITPDGDTLTLVINPAEPDNPDYIEALTTLLCRLAVRRAVITAAATDTRDLGVGPLALDADTEPEKVRMRLTREQSTTGDNRQRMRLTLTVPGYTPADADRLAADLAAPPRSAPDAMDVLTPLLGVELPTISRRAVNRIVGFTDGAVTVATGKSPAGEPVPVAWVQEALDLLWDRGTVRVSVEQLGHRSSFLGALLSALPGTTTHDTPPTVSLTNTTPGNPREKTFATLDQMTLVKYRLEQGDLRAHLLNGRAHADCALCGHVFPKRLLVAAHIKQRSECTDPERRDLANIAMLACAFGCDALYELGLVTVTPDGLLHIADTVDHIPGRFADHLTLLAGRRCTAHRPETEPYFAWHRDHRFASWPTAS
ncbi:hypothetical protein ACOBQX_26000 [Actinokineospora sp. G85]|uniref:hypothetical protein n=1 Tax=Actinokineospora sp. G85 TaxID=3406626 RepID=UPI003C72AFE8